MKSFKTALNGLLMQMSVGFNLDGQLSDTGMIAVLLIVI